VAPLVAPKVVRFTIYGQNLGRPWANIFDCQHPAGRPAAASDFPTIAKKLVDAYNTNKFMFANNCEIDGCKWIDLDNLNGSSGIVTSGTAVTCPILCTGGVDPAPASVAYLMIKSTGGGRNTRNGRTYLAGITEGATNGNSLTSLANGTKFGTDVAAALNGTYSGFVCAFVVAGSDRTGTVNVNPVTGYTPDAKVATQRRRLRR
jgi:hypothetical protein